MRYEINLEECRQGGDTPLAEGWYWILEGMMGNTGQTQRFGPYTSKEEALEFYNGEKVDSYEDMGPDMFDYGNGENKKKYYKSFRKGGPLEWINAPWSDDFETPDSLGCGLYEVVHV